jgi:hypothetical protein
MGMKRRTAVALVPPDIEQRLDRIVWALEELAQRARLAEPDYDAIVALLHPEQGDEKQEPWARR